MVNPYKSPELAVRKRKWALVVARVFRVVMQAGALTACLSYMFMLVFVPAQNLYNDFIGGRFSFESQNTAGFVAIRACIGGVVATVVGWIGRWVSVAIAREPRHHNGD